MTKKILLALVASVVVAIVAAPIAGANPVSTQYDAPTITQPPVTTPTVTPPVTDATVTPPTVTEPTTTEPTTTEPTTTEPTTTEPVTEPVTKATAASNTVDSGNATTTQPAPATVSSSDELPFTGLDLGLFLVIGGVAVASGLGLRRVAARRTHDR